MERPHERMDAEIGLINVLASVGLTIIIVYGEPIKPIRTALGKISQHFADLLACTLCTGLWVGVFFWAVSHDWRWPFITAILAWLFDALHTYLQKK